MDVQKPQTSGVGDALYGGLATYGKINVIIGSVISAIIVLALLIIGTKLFFSKDKQTKIVEGTVSDVNFNSGTNTYNFVVHYSVDSNQYAIQSSGKAAAVGQKINILYNPQNPSDARLASSMSNKTLGGILLIIGFVVALLTGLTLYFTLKYKEFAAIEGGMTAASQITGLFRR